VFTTETPVEEVPPPEAPPPLVVPRQGRDGAPFLQEIVPPEERTIPKEETVARVREPIKLPLGEQGTTVIRYINRLTRGDEFTPASLWANFDQSDRDKWSGAYGGRNQCVAKVGKAISNVRLTNGVNADSVKGKRSTYRYNGPIRKRGKVVRDRAKVAGKPKVKAVTPPPASKVRLDLADYKLVGTLTDGRNLYVGPEGKIGVFEFKALNPASL